MTISRKQNGTALEIALTGRLDSITAPQLAAEVSGSLDGIDRLVWDFSDLEYISSAGIRVLLLALNELDEQAEMKVVHPNELVRTAFRLTGLGDLITGE